MPVQTSDKVVHAVAKYPTSSSYGKLKCGGLYVGRYSRSAASARRAVWRTVTVKEPVSCIGCLAEAWL